MKAIGKGLNTQPQSAPGTHLYGRRIVIARIAWGILVFLTLSIFIILLPSYFALLQSICTNAVCTLVQPAPATVQAMQKLGFSVESYAVMTLALTLITMLASLIISGVIFWRKSDDWMALLVAFGLVLMGTLYVTDVLQQSHSAWQLLAIVLNIPGNGVLFLIGSLFPNGQFVPRWSRWLVIGWILWGIIFIALRDLPSAYLFAMLVWLTIVTCLAGGQFYRYRNVSSFIERQQTKWVVFAGSILGLALVGLTLPGLIFPTFGQAGSFYQIAIGPLYPLSTLLLSLSIAIAILRYRLWDIDLIINRTLVYGTLTLMLALVYFGLVIGLQSLVHLVTGTIAEQPLVIVASTLAIAALFQPLRRRIQTVIDRRFYRSKYDAAKTLEAFSATLRNEVDLSQLSEQLVEVVEETMQPTHVSLWLLPTAPARKQQVTWISTPPAEGTWEKS
jgi:hypothetical protein